MSRVKLIVPGDPVPNARARKGRGGNWYTPRPTVEFRERVQTAWLVEGKPSFGSAPLELSATFVFARKPSHLKADGTPRKGAPQFPPRGSADLSNLVKNCEDALDGLLFENDTQVISYARVVKRYAFSDEEPHTELEVHPLPV
jgi:Holliday junction resolvase RusA-like endonuclease